MSKGRIEEIPPLEHEERRNVNLIGFGVVISTAAVLDDPGASITEERLSLLNALRLAYRRKVRDAEAIDLVCVKDMICTCEATNLGPSDPHLIHLGRNRLPPAELQRTSRTPPLQISDPAAPVRRVVSIAGRLAIAGSNSRTLPQVTREREC